MSLYALDPNATGPLAARIVELDDRPIVDAPDCDEDPEAAPFRRGTDSFNGDDGTP